MRFTLKNAEDCTWGPTPGLEKSRLAYILNEVVIDLSAFVESPEKDAERAERQRVRQEKLKELEQLQNNDIAHPGIARLERKRAANFQARLAIATQERDMLRELVSSSPEEREAQTCAKHITRGLDRDAVVRLREALAGMTVDGVEEAVARSKHIDDIGGIVHFDEAQDRSNYINGVGGMKQVQGAISLRRPVESHYPKAEFGSLARMIEGLVEMCRAEGDNAVLQFPKLLEHGSKCLKISRTDPLRIMVGIQEALSLVAQAGGNKQLKLQLEYTEALIASRSGNGSTSRTDRSSSSALPTPLTSLVPSKRPFSDAGVEEGREERANYTPQTSVMESVEIELTGQHFSAVVNEETKAQPQQSVEAVNSGQGRGSGTRLQMALTVPTVVDKLIYREEIEDDLAEYLQDKLYKEIERDPARRHAWKSMEATGKDKSMPDGCILTHVISRRPRSNFDEGARACVTCRNKKRPCGALVEKDGVEVVVFMPLPRVWRQGDWTDRSFWIQGGV